MFQLTNRYRYQFVGEGEDNLNIKEIIQRATLWLPKECKNAIPIFIAFSIDVLIRDENIISEERKTKKAYLK